MKKRIGLRWASGPARGRSEPQGALRRAHRPAGSAYGSRGGPTHPAPLPFRVTQAFRSKGSSDSTALSFGCFRHR